MSFKIDGGLFKFDFTDHHAILGVPIDADFLHIRKRYLQIARCLHPDSCAAESEVEKQQASQLLSKLVNPAYEKFSKQTNRIEYSVLLKQMGKHLVQASAATELKHKLSKQLAQTNNIDYTYKTLLSQLVEQQYDSFNQVLPLIAQISELNMVYLMRIEGKTFHASPPFTQTKLHQKEPAAPLPAVIETVVEQYCRRAQELMAKNNFAQARVELQDALKLEPNSCRCHSLIGVVYLKQNQNTMAKVHIKKALQLNPKDSMALKGKQLLIQAAQKASSNQTTPKTTQGKQLNKPGGGLFGGLFSGKKK